ncbi:MAG: hypothetical protein QNJ12_20670 [Ilumatobacter sp.]|uniref:SDH family Clp fold serine proteinase n=1 Tax=Ilumatobacter sp. TaxID=1967498 RepID=UPI00263575BF|nr:hypothetical protein [Ilumatobacter sp.]MDJ0771214.1 hypothetical protein [Ilumatobacter sp.]
MPNQQGELEQEIGHPVALVHAPLEDQAVRMLYECLRRLGPTGRLGLVLNTVGGSVSAARRLVLIAREFCDVLVVLVPYKARSAGTLVCLGADELVLGRMAELSPIDAQISSAPQAQPRGPGEIGAEDVKAFRNLAQEWFDVTRPEDRIQVLALLAQAVFPPTLGYAYRVTSYTRRVATELLRHQIPGAEPCELEATIDLLMGASTVHDAQFTRSDAVAMGLNVVEPSEKVERLIWDLVQGAQHAMARDETLNGIVARAEFRAQRRSVQVESASQDSSPHGRLLVHETNWELTET